ncbi:hypothetical protein ACFFGH_11950 [Lysobacter korlensis]|uniref:Uncharacterized protein n=1 Tax=Lysobacter korlensis TaxID=553636 RepID=A0ABV6RQ45_9GAMM
MTGQSARTGHRRRALLIAALLTGATLVALMVGLPANAVMRWMLESSIGRVTVVEDEAGGRRTVYWREYPGVAGVDSRDVLDGPSAEEAYAASEAMTARMRAAITAEFGLEWAPPASAEQPFDPFHERTQNWYGGESMLTTVNGPTSQTIGVPTDWSDKERMLEIIARIAADYGFSAPTLDADSWDWTEEDRIRDLGGATPEEQVIVAGSMMGPTGQWMFFTFQDLSKDVDGRFERDLAPSTEHGWQLNTFSFGFGANALLPEGDEAEFERRLAPFEGLEPPEPVET